MKIGFDAKRAFHNRTGLGNYSRDLIQGLINLEMGSSFYLFNPKPDSHWKPIGESFKIISPTSNFHKRFHTLWRRKKISKLAEELQLDVYHGLSHELPIGIENSSCKKVVTIHDLIFERFPKQYKGIDRLSYRTKIKHACDVADKIVCVSAFTATELIELYEVNKEKIEIIWPSIHPLFFEKDLGQLPNGLPENYYLSVGTFEARKQQKEMLNLLSQHSTANLVLVGKENRYAQELKDLAKQLKVEKRLFVLHQTSMEQLQSLYKKAKAFVYASSFEGFGLPIAEAMASNCPVICPDLPLYQEVTDGKAYFYPDKAWDLMSQLILDLEEKALLREKVDQAKEISLRYKPEVAAQKTHDLYRGLIS